VIPDFSGKPGTMGLFVYVAVAQKRGIAKVGQIDPLDIGSKPDVTAL
jgi:hypothetical protein